MTRDSLWFSWLAVIGGLAGYLATGPSPATWDFAHWMQVVVVATGLIAAKLGSSPLLSSEEKGQP
jgi:uncharacterized membrane protein (UPF0136 family)